MVYTIALVRKQRQQEITNGSPPNTIFEFPKRGFAFGLGQER